MRTGTSSWDLTLRYPQEQLKQQEEKTVGFEWRRLEETVIVGEEECWE